MTAAALLYSSSSSSSSVFLLMFLTAVMESLASSVVGLKERKRERMRTRSETYTLDE